MHWKLWLAQPETERTLETVLRVTAAAVVLWALTAAYGVWSTRTGLAAAQAAVLQHSRHVSEITRGLPEKRRQALRASEVQVLPAQGAGSAEVTEEFADLARVDGAEVRGVRIGDGGQAGAAPATPAAASASGTDTAGSRSATATPAAQASAGGGDVWSQETFECNITGGYPALTRFLSGLAASRRILDITSLQVSGDNAGARTNAARLMMRVSGIVYETSGTP